MQKRPKKLLVVGFFLTVDILLAGVQESFPENECSKKFDENDVYLSKE